MVLDGIVPQFLAPWSDEAQEKNKGWSGSVALSTERILSQLRVSHDAPLTWIKLNILSPKLSRSLQLVSNPEPPSPALSFPIDLLSASLGDIATALESGFITSEALVVEYLNRIDKDNHDGLNLCAVIESAPRHIVRERARQLDQERKAGHSRGPLHGIPIIIKDSIYTDKSLGMETTAGVHAFVGSITPGNAPVVENLMRAGAIIIGKANLTVLNSLYGSGLTHGWSPRGGQTLSPYTLEPSPHGSSSGSAVALAAGQCAASVGSETCGSIIDPGTRAGLFSFKPSFGLIPGERVISISFRQDVLGPFGKSSWDVAAMLSGMVNLSSSHNNDYTECVSSSCADLSQYKLGIWDQLPSCPTVHITESSSEVYVHFQSAVRTIKNAYPESIINEGVKIDSPVETRDIPEEQGFKDGVWYGRYINLLLSTDLHESINTHLENLKGSEFKDIDDLIKWNDKHPELAFPNGGPQTEDSQRYLRWARDSQGRKDSAYDIALDWLTSSGERVRKQMEEAGLDALILPCWSKDAALLSASIGFPMASIPIGTLENGNPTALWIFTKPGDDKMLLSIMGGCEKLFNARPLPHPLLGR